MPRITRPLYRVVRMLPRERFELLLWLEVRSYATSPRRSHERRRSAR